MAKQRHQLDARVLTAFFFAAMPFVAFGSFIVVNQARTLLRESVGASLEQRAVQTKLALEQYVGDQVVHLRLVALDPEVQRALEQQAPRAARGRTARAARAGLGLRQGPQAQRLDRRQRRSRPACSRSPSCGPPSGRSRSSTPRGRLVAASSRGGTPLLRRDRVVQGPWRPRRASRRRTSASSSAPPGSTDGAPRDRVSRCATRRRLARRRAGARRRRAISTPCSPRCASAARATPSLLRATDGLVLASDESERILKTPLPGFESLRNAVEGFPLGDSGRQLFGSAGQRRGYWTIPDVTAPGRRRPSRGRRARRGSSASRPSTRCRA